MKLNVVTDWSKNLKRKYPLFMWRLLLFGVGIFILYMLALIWIWPQYYMQVKVALLETIGVLGGGGVAILLYLLSKYKRDVEQVKEAKRKRLEEKIKFDNLDNEEKIVIFLDYASEDQAIAQRLKNKLEKDVTHTQVKTFIIDTCDITDITTLNANFDSAGVVITLYDSAPQEWIDNRFRYYSKRVAKQADDKAVDFFILMPEERTFSPPNLNNLSKIFYSEEIEQCEQLESFIQSIKNQ